jgi:hypothetical protein
MGQEPVSEETPAAMAKRIRTEYSRADIRGIEQPIALQILKTLARYAHRSSSVRMSWLTAFNWPVLR